MTLGLHVPRVQPSEQVEDSITEGALVRPLFALAWPIVVTQLLQVAYNIPDTLWLGQLSAAAVGALSLAFPLIFLVLSVGGGFTVPGRRSWPSTPARAARGRRGRSRGRP